MLAILWWVLLGLTVTKPLDYGFDYSPVEQVSTQTIHHSGFSSGDQRQAIIQYAYDLGGLDFVTMIECENGNRSLEARWDRGHAWGLCQMNDRYHKIPSEYFGDWKFQVDYCYKKWSTWTPFYWPDRRIKGMKCRDYVRDRFIINLLEWSEKKI